MKPNKTLYVITCATLIARHIETFVRKSQEKGWDPWVIGTPNSRGFLDVANIEQLTGHEVEFEYRNPDAPRKRPQADAVAVVGASFNTVNKWALGIADNLALSLLSESVSYSVPVVLLPFINEAMSKHPSLDASVAALRRLGITVIFGQGINEPHPPHTAKTRVGSYPWGLALDKLDQAGPVS